MIQGKDEEKRMSHLAVCAKCSVELRPEKSGSVVVIAQTDISRIVLCKLDNETFEIIKEVLLTNENGNTRWDSWDSFILTRFEIKKISLAANELSGKEKEIVSLLKADSKISFANVAKTVEVSRERVRQIANRAGIFSKEAT